MEFSNEFDVAAPIDEVYGALLDLERVAPCVPGARVLARTGEDSYEVGIEVKVGPMSMQYRGEVEIVEKDPEGHAAVMRARAREARGQGTASAHVRMSLSGDGAGTHGQIATGLQLSGKAAAMGQGVIQDVSARIVEQFAANLAAMLSREAGEEAPAPGGEARPAAGGPAEAEAGTEGAAEGLDVLRLASGVAAERMRDPRALLPALGIAFLVGVLVGRRRRI